MANDARVSTRKRPRAFGHLDNRTALETAEPFKGLKTNSPWHVNTLTGAPIETLEALGTAVP